jgi:hypothetical protein
MTTSNDHLCVPNHIALWLGKVESLRVLREYDESCFGFMSDNPKVRLDKPMGLQLLAEVRIVYVNKIMFGDD